MDVSGENEVSQKESFNFNGEHEDSQVTIEASTLIASLKVKVLLIHENVIILQAKVVVEGRGRKKNEQNFFAFDLSNSSHLVKRLKSAT